MRIKPGHARVTQALGVLAPSTMALADAGFEPAHPPKGGFPGAWTQAPYFPRERAVGALCNVWPSAVGLREERLGPTAPSSGRTPRALNDSNERARIARAYLFTGSSVAFK